MAYSSGGKCNLEIDVLSREQKLPSLYSVTSLRRNFAMQHLLRFCSSSTVGAIPLLESKASGLRENDLASRLDLLSPPNE